MKTTCLKVMFNDIMMLGIRNYNGIDSEKITALVKFCCRKKWLHYVEILGDNNETFILHLEETEESNDEEETKIFNDIVDRVIDFWLSIYE